MNKWKYIKFNRSDERGLQYGLDIYYDLDYIINNNRKKATILCFIK